MDSGVLEALNRAHEWINGGRDYRSMSTFQNPEYKSLMAQLEEAVAAHPILGSLTGKLVRSGSAGAAISNNLVASALLERACQTGSVETAVSRTVEFISNPRLDVLTVVSLSGVTAQTTIELSEKVAVSPPEELPQSESFFRLFPTPDHRRLSPWAVLPTAALTRRWTIENAICEATLENFTSVLDEQEDFDFDRAFACLVLSSREGVQRIHRYHENLHTGHLWPGSGWSEHPTALTFREPIAVDGDALRDIFSLTAAFSDWPEFFRLVKRLNSARLKADLVDAHIDLGIVAECALTRGEKNESEISHRMRTRGAWLLGRNADDRRTVAKAIGDLYSRRSSAAHTGTVSKSRRELFEADDELCRRLLTALLRRGAFPRSEDWSSITFG